MKVHKTAERMNGQASGNSFPDRALLEALPGEVVAVDDRGVIIYANQLFCEQYHINTQEVVGMLYRSFGEDHSLLQLLESALETKLLFSHGKEIVIQCNVIFDGVISGALQICIPDDGIFNTIISDENYSNISQDLNKLFTSNWDVIYASDADGITLEVSSAAKSIWGVEAEELIGKSVYELEKQRIFFPSVTRLVLETRRRVQAIQVTGAGKRLLVLGTPIKNEKGEIVRVINTSRLIVDESDLRSELEDARTMLEAYRQELLEARLKEQKDTPFTAKSPGMKQAVELANKVAGADITVLITGESGAGKEVLASYIHSQSTRKDRSYIKINCGAIPETLLESELFGYEKGAFTGAEKNGKPGVFELANHGTLFLDEIGEIPKEQQVKLLRVLQESELMRVGGTKTIKVDVRVIAATNRNLEEEVKKGNFRKDLFYRLCVVPINIPPLRERSEDILPLAMAFLTKYNLKYGQDKSFSQGVLERFMEYEWEGNIRELQNTVERLVLLASDNVIDIDALPGNFVQQKHSDPIYIDEIIPLREAQQILEDKLIEMARKKYRTTTKIAEVLGMNQSTISRKLRK